MRQTARLPLLLGALCLLLTGCFYESEITEVRFNLGEERCFQGEMAGLLRFTLVLEQRKPWGPGRFPDGGTPLDVAAYILVGHNDREAGRIDLPLYRRGDFGNLEHREFTCEEPNLLHYRVENGYGQDRKVTEGELTIPSPP